MEENFYHTDFEDYLKEKVDQYKMYPSDKVWKGLDRSMRSHRKWYWTGFVLLLSGISYFAITELASPRKPQSITQLPAPVAQQSQLAPEVINPFNTDIGTESSHRETSVSRIIVEDSGSLTASFDIPVDLLGIDGADGQRPRNASLLITGLEPLQQHEKYNIELIWPEFDGAPAADVAASTAPSTKTSQAPPPADAAGDRINWLDDVAGYKLPASRIRHLSWQLAFSPTVNYRRLNSSENGKQNMGVMPGPPADRDVNNVVNHVPALGFELGTHALLNVSKRLTVKGGVQFNYSKYDIAAFRTGSQTATIALNSSLGTGPRTLTSYTDINNFSGSRAESLKNQYFQLSVPVGFEYRVFGNNRLQFNVASTIQPTYLLNSSTYLITTDYKNYTKEPSLVRRWNMNAGAEAFISYNRSGVKWQIGPQFRYQLLSSYDNAYPIKEYLMEYGIKVGITKTIR